MHISFFFNRKKFLQNFLRSPLKKNTRFPKVVGVSLELGLCWCWLSSPGSRPGALRALRVAYVIQKEERF